MPRKPLPKNVTAKQAQADIQAGRSEIAGHAMIKRNPPKTSVRTWLRSKIGLGPPKAETDRQKKIRDALESAKGATKRAAKRAVASPKRPARRFPSRGGSRR
jgi:hypothetical protein